MIYRIAKDPHCLLAIAPIDGGKIISYNPKVILSDKLSFTDIEVRDGLFQAKKINSFAHCKVQTRFNGWENNLSIFSIIYSGEVKEGESGIRYYFTIGPQTTLSNGGFSLVEFTKNRAIGNQTIAEGKEVYGRAKRITKDGVYSFCATLDFSNKKYFSYLDNELIDDLAIPFSKLADTYIGRTYTASIGNDVAPKSSTGAMKCVFLFDNILTLPKIKMLHKAFITDEKQIE